jgi:hypothetical protein
MNDFRHDLAEAILLVLRGTREPLPAAEVARRVAAGAGLAAVTEAQVRSFLRDELAGRVVHAGGDAWLFAARAPRPADGAEPPACPRCSALLEIRKWRKGPHAGRKFWGCPRYREKKCSYTRDLAPGETPPPLER